MGTGSCCSKIYEKKFLFGLLFFSPFSKWGSWKVLSEISDLAPAENTFGDKEQLEHVVSLLLLNLNCTYIHEYSFNRNKSKISENCILIIIRVRLIPRYLNKLLGNSMRKNRRYGLIKWVHNITNNNKVQ